MKNLKNETLEVLAEHGKNAASVMWVGTEGFTIPTDDFWKLADKTYNDGYGAPEVATDLIVVGEGWWLERHEYDGSEWWEYKEHPSCPLASKKVYTLFPGMWGDLGDCLA